MDIMKDRKITAIISARTGSSRLPNKVLLDISGKTALERMIERVKNAKTIDNIIIAYEPIWSIGTGKIPSKNELTKSTIFIKSIVKKMLKKKTPIVLYGGSVDENSVNLFKQIKEIDGFLIGGASKSSKKFIDIIKNYYT